MHCTDLLIYGLSYMVVTSSNYSRTKKDYRFRKDVEGNDRGITVRFRGLPHLSQTNAEIVPQIMPQPLPSKPLPIH